MRRRCGCAAQRPGEHGFIPGKAHPSRTLPRDVGGLHSPWPSSAGGGDRAPPPGGKRLGGGRNAPTSPIGRNAGKPGFPSFHLKGGCAAKRSITLMKRRSWRACIGPDPPRWRDLRDSWEGHALPLLPIVKTRVRAWRWLIGEEAEGGADEAQIGNVAISQYSGERL